MSAHDRHDLGRTRGWWIPDAEVEAYLFNGWTIADLSSHRGHTLMAPPQQQEEQAA